MRKSHIEIGGVCELLNEHANIFISRTSNSYYIVYIYDKVSDELLFKFRAYSFKNAIETLYFYDRSLRQLISPEVEKLGEAI